MQTTGRLAAQGADVLAATTWSSRAGGRLRQLQASGVRHVLLEESLPMRFLSRVRPPKRPGCRPLGRLISSWKPALIFFNSGTLLDGLPHLEEIAASGVPYLTLTHLVSTDNWPDDATAAALMRLFSGAKRAGFVSQHNLSLFETQAAASLTNSHIWRNPYLVSHERAPTWPEGEPLRLAFPARIHPRTKGHDLLLKVMGQEKWRTRPLSVSIFGKGPWEKSLCRLIQQRGLESSVHQRGHSQDIQALWDDHHALVLPSRHEGLPICVVEAMMAGRPCIVNPAGGSAELLDDGVTGFVSRECSWAALDEALERAWQRRDEWRLIGLRAAERVRQLVPADPPQTLAKALFDLN